MHSIQVYLIFFVGVLFVQAQQCPEIYQRFSDHHTYCLPANRSCNIVQRGGLTANDKLEILKFHNQYRNKIAMGQERRAGGMPQAANMLELVWDDELASVAQKLTETCVFDHDCNACRKVRAFSVGQNLGEKRGGSVSQPGWKEFIDGLYNEVQFFSNQYVNSYVEGPPAGHPRQYGHFTQLVWAHTWRVGCGWTLHREGSTMISYTACNYGPGGNVLSSPMYQTGAPCSQCPSNTCCGSSCRNQRITSTYQGLCKVIDTSKPPKPVVSPGQYTVYCDFNNQQDCAGRHEGQPWKIIKTPGGNWLSVILSGGQKSTFHFNVNIRSTDSVCFQMESRSAAVNFRDEPRMSIVGKFNIPAWRDSVEFPTDYRKQNTKEKRQDFMYHSYNIGVASDMKLSLEASVPPGAAPQFFEIRRFTAKSGSC